MSPHGQKPKRTQIMTLQEMAKYLGVHEMTVYRLLHRGELPGFKVGRQWRTKKEVLDAWLLNAAPNGIKRSRRSTPRSPKHA